MATTYPYLRTTGTRVTFGIQMGEISKLVFTCGKEEEKKIFIVKHGLLERIILQAPDLQYPLKPRYSGILPSHIGIENRRQVGNVIQCPLQYPKTKTKDKSCEFQLFPYPLSSISSSPKSRRWKPPTPLEPRRWLKPWRTTRHPTLETWRRSTWERAWWAADYRRSLAKPDVPHRAL